jgi:hypothetical protein
MKKEYKLNIDPRILELLGPSLYTNIYYVLAELIANAYDADAKNVYIIANKDDITVEDDGRGMSYDRGEISQYLNVGGESRTTEDQSTTAILKRRKMGRKGVGKLAALSVSENVLVKTISGNERSGFVLSRRPQQGNYLAPIEDHDVRLANGAAEKISSIAGGLGDTSRTEVRDAIAASIDDNCFDIGLKKEIDSLKKKILISQTLRDKPFADIVYQMLCYNHVPAEHILYTNCDDEVCRVPEDMHVYNYLRDFFVESYSTEKIYVIFITSDNTKRSWGAITEVGAAWITQVDHKIFNIYPFRPEHPLNDETLWQTTNRDPSNQELWMLRMNADIFCQKIEAICKRLEYKHRGRNENMNHLTTLVNIRERV